MHKGLVDDIQHGAERLAEVLLPQPICLLLGFQEFLGGDLAGVQQPPLVFLGDFEQPWVVLVAFPHRLWHEDAPKPDSAVEGAGRVEHLEVEFVESFEHRGPVVFRIERGGQGRRGAPPVAATWAGSSAAQGRAGSASHRLRSRAKNSANPAELGYSA